MSLPQPSLDENWKPKLRPVQVHPVPDDEHGALVMTDPTGLSDMALTISQPVAFVLSTFDGTRTLSQTRQAFQEAFGQSIQDHQLESIVEHLSTARFFEGEAFEAFYAEKLQAYRERPTRPMESPENLGLAHDIPATLDEYLDGADHGQTGAAVEGIIAPHLDYPRGRPCYSAAYGYLRESPAPTRVIILGTNHFGRSTSVCATGKDFETPLGVTTCDLDFLERLEVRCGDLRMFELDHGREHSIEMQVLWLQHLFGTENIRMVACLCPDPCGPHGTRPHDGRGVDLGDFADHLRELIREDAAQGDGQTLIIAGADLSHMGTFFGEGPALNDMLLKSIEDHDQRALAKVAAGDWEGFRSLVSNARNWTHICSVGCIYALLRALRPGTAIPLSYHQAVMREIDNCVTCCAFALGR